MSQADWFRRKTWTEKDRAEFFARNRRSRGPDSKAQYMRIQAETLLHTGERALIEAALALLEQSFVDYPGAMDCAGAYDAAGRCCEAVGKYELALDYYQKALAREREFPGIQSNACFHFAALVAEQNRSFLFDDALEELRRFGHPVFPWHAYMISGVRAVIANRRGHTDLARTYAQRALEAAGVRDSGLGWGREAVGLVKDTRGAFYREIEALAGPNKTLEPTA